MLASALADYDLDTKLRDSKRELDSMLDKFLPQVQNTILRLSLLYKQQAMAAPRPSRAVSVPLPSGTNSSGGSMQGAGVSRGRSASIGIQGRPSPPRTLSPSHSGSTHSTSSSSSSSSSADRRLRILEYGSTYEEEAVGQRGVGIPTGERNIFMGSSESFSAGSYVPQTYYNSFATHVKLQTEELQSKMAQTVDAEKELSTQIRTLTRLKALASDLRHLSVEDMKRTRKCERILKEAESLIRKTDDTASLLTSTPRMEEEYVRKFLDSYQPVALLVTYMRGNLSVQ